MQRPLTDTERAESTKRIQLMTIDSSFLLNILVVSLAAFLLIVK